MKESEILQYIKEKGYLAEKVYYMAADEDGPQEYTVLVTKDWPKLSREPRRWFGAHTLTELFYKIQKEL